MTDAAKSSRAANSASAAGESRGSLAPAAGVPEKKLADETADRLRHAILSGEFPPGSDLPGERDLATKLGVSRLTLRSALTRLEAEQLVKPVHGSGTRVLDFRETGGIELLGHLFTIAITNPVRGPAGTPGEILSDVLELRRLVAIEVIGLAAERAREEELDALEAQVDRLEALVDDVSRFMPADIGLALSLVKATHSLALLFLSNTIARVLLAQPGIEAAFGVNPRGSIAVYRRIAALLRARDSQGARRLTRMLLAKMDRALVGAIVALTSQPQATGVSP